MVPSSLPPSSPKGPLESPDAMPQPAGGGGGPGEANMLMALATMHDMGRLKPKAKIK